MSSRHSISTNPLEYAAEVAYIVATSPPVDAASAGPGAGGKSEDEFEFSLSETQFRRGLDLSVRETQGDGERQENPKSAEAERGEGRKEADGVNSLPAVSDRRPAEKKSIDEKISSEEHKTVVIYGPTNYANRQLVTKLVQSNPSLFTLVVPHTTRKQHQNEINGVDFHFTGRKEMSAQVKKGHFVECVKISSPKLRVRKTTPTVNVSQASSDGSGPASPASPSEDHSFPLNPWRNIVQVPSPLLTPKSRQKTPKNGKSYELYGTSKVAIHEAHLQGKPCMVLSVTHKGAEQLKKAGLGGVYILLDVGGEGGEGTDSTDAGESGELRPDCHITTEDTEQAFAELQRHTFQAVSSLPLSPRSKVDVTRDEWKNMPTVAMDHQLSEASSPVSKVRLLTFNHLLVHYQRERIGTKQTKAKIATLAKGLRSECDLVLSLSDVPLSDKHTLHMEALQTVYQKLMGSSLNCRRYGPHWQDVGFTGVDPGENLKETGFYGVMQLVSFLDQNLALALEIFNYSRDSTHKFPFAVVSVGLTEVALKSLRGGHLTKLCNKHDQVFVTLNDYHMAMFYRFFLLWKSQTAAQVLPVIRDVESYSKKHPKIVMADLQAYMVCGKDDHELIGLRKISHSLSNPFTPFHRFVEEKDQQELPSPS